MNKKIILKYIIYWLVYSIIFTTFYLIIHRLYLTYISWDKLSSGIMQESTSENFLRVTKGLLVIYFIFTVCLSPILLILPFIIWSLKKGWATINDLSIYIGTQIVNVISLSVFYYYLSQAAILGLDNLLQYRYFIFVAIGAVSALLSTRIVLISVIETFQNKRSV